MSISIIQRGDAGGVTTFAPPPQVVSKVELERQVVTGLAGRAADEILSGGATSGAVGDLRNATRLLAAGHGAFGFGDSLVSRFGIDRLDEEAHLDADILKSVNEDLDRLLDAARVLVREHSRLILAVADWLVSHRVATLPTVEALANMINVRASGPNSSVGGFPALVGSMR